MSEEERIKHLEAKLWLSEEQTKQWMGMYRSKEEEVRGLLTVIEKLQEEKEIETSSDGSSKEQTSVQSTQAVRREPTSGPYWQPSPKKSVLRRYDDA